MTGWIRACRFRLFWLAATPAERLANLQCPRNRNKTLPVAADRGRAKPDNVLLI